ncbi:MAG: alpha/beta hydrolase [Rhodoluna sp.]|nr:alpha/beta hydrolase [Rhodoluna sp.]
MAVESAVVAELAKKRGVERSTQIMGVATRYWFYPAGKSSKGALVFVHGFRGAHDGLHTIIGELTDYDCFAPDLPGYGASEPVAKPHDLETYSEWLGDFIASLKLPARPAVIGHSFGTMVVSAHAAAQEADMDEVVLINPVSKPSLQGPRRFISALTSALFWLTSRLPERGSRFFVDSWPVLQFVSSVMTKTNDKKLRAWIHAQHHTTMKNYANKAVMYESYLASAQHCVEEYAPKILNRTLMIAGERDDITSVAQQTEVSHKFPSASLVVIPKVGHLIHYEASARAAELIREFLEGKK